MHCYKNVWISPPPPTPHPMKMVFLGVYDHILMHFQYIYQQRNWVYLKQCALELTSKKNSVSEYCLAPKHDAFTSSGHVYINIVLLSNSVKYTHTNWEMNYENKLLMAYLTDISKMAIKIVRLAVHWL